MLDHNSTNRKYTLKRIKGIDSPYFEALLRLVSLDPTKHSKDIFITKILQIINQTWRAEAVEILDKKSPHSDDMLYTKYSLELANPIEIELPYGYTNWVVKQNRYLLITHCDLSERIGFGCSGELGDTSHVREEAIRYILKPPALPPKEKHEKSLVVYPLCRRGLIIGTIKLCSYTNENYFSLEDVSAFHPFGEAIATLLQNASLITELTDKNAELSSLNTELKLYGDRIRLSESLAFGAMMAHQHFHELSNLIGSLFGSQEQARFLIESLRVPGDTKRKLVLAITDLDKRLHDVKRKIKSLLKAEPKQQDLHMEKINLKDLVNDELKHYARIFEEQKIKSRHTLGKADVAVFVDTYSMRYVIRILVNNAINALIESSKTHKSLHLGSKISNGWVHVRFKDTGCGIDPGARRKIFDAFYTTDPDHRHGVGLFFAKKIVEDYFKGTLRLLDSYPGKGAVFEVQLPVAKKEA